MNSPYLLLLLMLLLMLLLLLLLLPGAHTPLSPKPTHLPAAAVFTDHNRPFANLMEARKLKIENLLSLRDSGWCGRGWK